MNLETYKYILYVSMRMKAVVMLLHREIRCHDLKCHRKPQSHATLAILNLED